MPERCCDMRRKTSKSKGANDDVNRAEGAKVVRT